MEKELILDYQNGFTFKQLVDKYKITKYKIKKILTENNIHIRIGRERVPFTKEQEADIINMYNNHSGMTEIAKKYECSYETVKSILVKNNVNFVQWKKINRNLKEDFFKDIKTEEQAYLLGLLFTDGYIKQNGTIGIFLQDIDIDMIQKIKEILCIDGQIQFDKRVNKESCGIEFTSLIMQKDLSSFKIIPNKTYLSEGLPDNVPEELLNHFFRGLFDGDGIFSYSGKDDSSIGFCSYFLKTVEDFQKHIDNIINKTEHNKIRKNNAYQCSWKGRKQIIQILEYLYKDASIYLERKHLKYLKLKIS